MSVKPYKNSKDAEYYFHMKGKMKYFSRDPKDAVELPKGFEIVENKKTGLLFAKKES